MEIVVERQGSIILTEKVDWLVLDGLLLRVDTTVTVLIPASDTSLECIE